MKTFSDDEHSELLRILDQDAGPNDSVIDRALAGATEAMAKRQYVTAQKRITEAHDAIAKAGLAHASMRKLLAQAGGGVQTDAQPMKPGTAIGQVGDEVRGHGPINLADMSMGNWSHYQQHNLEKYWADMFNGVTIDEVHAAIGALPGNLATAPQDPFTKGGVNLEQWG